MSSRALFLFIVTLLGFTAIAGRAGMTADTAYTDRGQTDFDTVLQLLNPYGTWTKVDDKWAYLPSDHLAPYTEGRWLYTEYGWFWQGRLPHSWATEHYGYWKCNEDKQWLWYPGPFWLPQTVEIRASSSSIGWRSAEVDDDGNFVEQPIDRFAKTSEWTFVTLAQFANPITPRIIAPLSVIKQNLEDSTDSHHTYMTYRAIDRPGPHPADFVSLSRDGGMFAPKTISEEVAERTPPPKPPDTNSPAAHMTGTNAPALIGTDADPSVDQRKVKYWITMSLPTFWSKPPADAKPEQVYIYRPDMYQDQDGIERRITLWFNPKARTTLKDLMGANARTTPDAASADDTSATPAVPATSPAQDPFRSPLDDNFHSSSSGTTARSTNSPAKAGTPAGSNPDASN